ncbi:flagellar hook-basal body complex protein [Clostridium sardiniense]|uniref:flagellar hook-basal body complex protein n=1 Tax=Clostridium sardiniense TaxID=29369 RepID=UPI001FD3EAB0|nr:flagellar hook-basal body complex protein [Clostridium sardiniense]MDQ0460635.1 flagellar basal-body rod protein FlgG [Clostridium sardiniense]
MFDIVNIATSGMSSNQEKIDIISNNIVNVSTVGYKKLDTQFEDLVRKSMKRDSFPINDKNTTVGTGSKATEAVRIFTQGSLIRTDINSNMAIDGEGLFRVIKSDNTYAYTRNGEFNVDSSGKLVDNNGNILDMQFIGNNDYSNIGLKNNNFTINKLGEVFVNNSKVAYINTYKSDGNMDFLSIGDNLFSPKRGANIKVEKNRNIMQGYKEMSNVNMPQEMTDLIATQRAFQLTSKSFKVADDMWSMINNLQSR